MIFPFTTLARKARLAAQSVFSLSRDARCTAAGGGPETLPAATPDNPNIIAGIPPGGQVLRVWRDGEEVYDLPLQRRGAGFVAADDGDPGRHEIAGCQARGDRREGAATATPYPSRRRPFASLLGSLAGLALASTWGVQRPLLQQLMICRAFRRRRG